MNEQFLASMEKDSDAFSTKLRNCPRDELYLITPDYLTPYLSYIKNNKRLFRTATENAAVLGMDKSYDRMFRHVFTPILDRYGVLQQDRPYIMAFYIRGLMAIISEWLKNDCTDSITYVTGLIQQCVKFHKAKHRTLFDNFKFGELKKRNLPIKTYKRLTIKLLYSMF